MKSIIVIPVYKPMPDEAEQMSIRQCVKVLDRHRICLVCPEGLDTAVYDNVIGKRTEVKRFAPEFFDGIDGYNRLMKSHGFYERFKDYDYLLVYQLDAWVFRDELEEWCSKGYDYVGAPWFEEWRNHEEGYELMCVGNGGFSLRKVSKFLKITKPSARLYGFWQTMKSRQKGRRSYYRRVKDYLSHENSAGAFMEQKQDRWEDIYFCYDLTGTALELKTPDCREAAMFSIETSPKYLFQEVNGGQLPFGCHAWQRYQYDDFWKGRIKNE